MQHSFYADYTMPKMTGLHLARELRRIRPDTPVLLCTGFSEEITPHSVKKLGMGLLIKPYGMRQVSREVRKILDAKKQWRDEVNPLSGGFQSAPLIIDLTKATTQPFHVHHIVNLYVLPIWMALIDDPSPSSAKDPHR